MAYCLLLCGCHTTSPVCLYQFFFATLCFPFTMSHSITSCFFNEYFLVKKGSYCICSHVVGSGMCEVFGLPDGGLGLGGWVFWKFWVAGWLNSPPPPPPPVGVGCFFGVWVLLVSRPLSSSLNKRPPTHPLKQYTTHKAAR